MKKLLFLLTFFIFSISFGQNDKIRINLNKTSILELEREKFDPKNHTIELYDGKFVTAIDNIILFGSDGDMPKYKLKKATLIIENRKYNLQIDNMYNPWFGDSTNEKLFKIIKDGTQYILHGMFADGAGTYAAEWLIEEKASIRTILTKDEVLIEEHFEKK